MSKQKLDLVQLAASKVAEPRAAAPKIRRREFFDTGTLRGGLDAFLLKAADEQLSPRARKIKRQVKAKQAAAA